MFAMNHAPMRLSSQGPQLEAMESIKFTSLATLGGLKTVIVVGKDLMHPGTGVEIAVRSCHGTPPGPINLKILPFGPLRDLLASCAD